ncbi:3-dehydroquinate synthetase [Rhodospirillaceae bacterium LM-1]|nr:3-dehydroquinate synthetase [Rhodospirillaceae bacterium LM-1]
MFEPLVIQSHKGPYEVHFSQDALEQLNRSDLAKSHLIVDRRVADLYASQIDRLLAHPSLLLIDATETAKSLERFPGYVSHLVAKGVKRGHVLVAIGGGILQDITCFLAATMLRGLDWRFLPTTLLAQADSCIGSKSSINCADAKNILGTFTPPRRIDLSTRFLDTLDERDVRSGIGEMLKVHAIDGPASFQSIARDYHAMLADRAVLLRYLRASLEIKKRYIQQDEFDQGPRNIFNYGHSFGHAIEAATHFAVPHGIAVTIGLDMANHVAVGLGLCDPGLAMARRPVLKENYKGFEKIAVPFDAFMAALAKDKKNEGAGSVTVILPHGDGRIERRTLAVDQTFLALAKDFLESVRTQ